MSDTTHPTELSEREIEILEMVATGASNKEIAQKLSISTNTVKVHMRNIFSKIEVSSRTEATMWAVRNGLVQPFPENELAETHGDEIPDNKRFSSSRVIVYIATLIALVGTLALILWQVNRSSSAQPESTATNLIVQPSVSRWQNLTEMEIGRYGLTAVVFEGEIYVIGGQTTDGISGIVELYDPLNNNWVELASKPQPVKNVQAAVIGGRIYVPGGELVNGQLTEIMEVYDPRQDTWETAPNLPRPLSAYVLAVFEGKLYLFGGWDGTQYRREVYEFSPGTADESGRWLEKTPMPMGRGFAGAAVSEGKIYLIGGIDEDGRILSRSDIYSPALDDGSNIPWEVGMPLPEPRYKHGVTNVGDLLFVIGGTDLEGSTLSNLQFTPSANLWQRIENPQQQVWEELGVATLGTQLFTFGGLVDGAVSAQSQTYQAIFTIAVPLIP